MNWEEVGAIGQMLGSLAVFITLGYLAVQLRHARAEVRRSISQGRSAAVRELAIHRSDNVHLNLASAKAYLALGGLRDRPLIQRLLDAGLTNDEVGAVVWDQWAFWYYRQQTVSQIDQLPPGERAEFDIGARGAYGRSPVGRLWYETTKATLNPDAVRYIDNLLAQPG